MFPKRTYCIFATPIADEGSAKAISGMNMPNSPLERHGDGPHSSADLAYVSTRFLGTRECAISEDCKRMLVVSVASDIVYTPADSGVPANFLAESLKVARIDPKTANKPKFDLGLELASALEKGEKRPCRDIWSAGHCVGGMSDLPAAAELIARMKDEYLKANAAQQALEDSWSQQERERRS